MAVDEYRWNGRLSGMIDIQIKENLQLMKKDQDIFKKLRSLQSMEILVGIPEQKTKRRRNNVMNNATLLMIHTKGSPLQGLPARPLIEPAISAQDNADKIADDVREIIKAVLNNQLDQARRLMSVTGQDAVNMIHNWFDDPRNGWEPDAVATVKSKLRKLGKRVVTKEERQEMIEEYLGGMSDINTTLVDTGQMRKAITYVINEGNK